ncbi:MAG: protein-methionine-sulfoxide reductase catalytic subunit MsrP [Rhodospirillaceae bacterium]|nr:protein-methionine-sulfoxide reductase catalytic subunit MsrP [Rhodospirillaceae bacterium]
MQIKIKKASHISEAEVTPKHLFMNRRHFIQASAAAGALGSILPPGKAAAGMKLPGITQTAYGNGLEQTKYEDVTSYNNFYEFGTGKSDPANNAQNFQTKPWQVSIEGAVAKPGVVDFDDLIKPHKLEERIYRFRCVEAWSMVVPWVGIPLADVIKRFEPTSKAKYVAFETLVDPERMPGQKRAILNWPYVEGLRMDEAMNPLALLAVGLYGEELPGQNGAPIRLVVPWKYGFKSIKSIVAIRFVEKMPPTTWNMSASSEYGFYSNVNPEVSHPRWSQAKERVIGQGYFSAKKETLKFNGYAEEVASLYSGMDLAKYY